MHSCDDRCAFMIPRAPDTTLFPQRRCGSPVHSELLSVGKGESLASSLGALAEHLRRLVPTDASTPLAALLLILVRAATQK